MEVNRIRIVNFKLVANTKAEWALPANCRWFTLQCRQAKDIRVSTEQGMENYFTIKSGKDWKEDNLDIKVRLPIFLNPGGNNVTMEAFIGTIEEV